MDEGSRAQDSVHIRKQALTYVGRQAHMIFPDSGGLPGTLVSGCSESGLSASEDTDHISEKRRIEAYRLKEGDRQGRTGREGGLGQVFISGQHIVLVILSRGNTTFHQLRLSKKQECMHGVIKKSSTNISQNRLL